MMDNQFDEERVQEVFITTLRSALSMNGQTLDVATAKLWVSVLETNQINLVVATQAIHMHLGDPDRGQYAIKPSDIVRLCVGDNDTHQHAAIAAYGEAIKAVGKIGHYRPIVFSDHCINVAITSMGGWKNFCLSEEPDGVKQSRFTKAYVAARLGYGSCTLPLAGVWGIDEVALYGNREQAIALLSEARQTPKPAGRLPAITVKTLTKGNDQ